MVIIGQDKKQYSKLYVTPKLNTYACTCSCGNNMCTCSHGAEACMCSHGAGICMCSHGAEASARVHGVPTNARVHMTWPQEGKGRRFVSMALGSAIEYQKQRQHTN